MRTTVRRKLIVIACLLFTAAVAALVLRAGNTECLTVIQPKQIGNMQIYNKCKKCRRAVVQWRALLGRGKSIMKYDIPANTSSEFKAEADEGELIAEEDCD
jgi:hypothetical protein